MNLRQAVDDLVDLHPEHAPSLRAGAYLVLAGRVAPHPHSGGWTVTGQGRNENGRRVARDYHVSRTWLDRDRVHWGCDCLQGRSFGPQAQILGWAAHWCKHQAAVGVLLRVADGGPEIPYRDPLPVRGGLLEMVSRIVEEQAVWIGETFGIDQVELPCGGQLVIRVESAVGPERLLALKVGYNTSPPLAILYEPGGRWLMDPEAGVYYSKWVAQFERGPGGGED